MANINNAIRKGFYDKLVANTAFKAAVLQVISTVSYYKLYYQQAPQCITGTTAMTFPYVIIDILPITQERDSGTKWYRCVVTFTVAAASASSAETVAGYITDALEDAESTTTITGYTLLKIVREPQVNLPISENVWQITVQYSVIIQPT